MINYNRLSFHFSRRQVTLYISVSFFHFSNLNNIYLFINRERERKRYTHKHCIVSNVQWLPKRYGHKYVHNSFGILSLFFASRFFPFPHSGFFFVCSFRLFFYSCAHFQFFSFAFCGFPFFTAISFARWFPCHIEHLYYLYVCICICVFIVFTCICVC